jgi:sulfur carrier protein
MQIHLNGAPVEIHEPRTIAGLLAEAGLAERRVAVELNGAIVPRGMHATQALREGDRVEIVHALGGG